MLATLSNILTVEDMIVAFEDEQHCRWLRMLLSFVDKGRVQFRAVLVPAP